MGPWPSPAQQLHSSHGKQVHAQEQELLERTDNNFALLVLVLCLTCKLKSKQRDFCAYSEDLLGFSCRLKNSLHSASSFCGWLIVQCRDHVSLYKVICFEFCIQNFFAFYARLLVALLPHTIINCVLLGSMLRSVISLSFMHYSLSKSTRSTWPRVLQFSELYKKKRHSKPICYFNITIYIIYKMGNYNINFSIKHFLGKL